MQNIPHMMSVDVSHATCVSELRTAAARASLSTRSCTYDPASLSRDEFRGKHVRTHMPVHMGTGYYTTVWLGWIADTQPLSVKNQDRLLIGRALLEHTLERNSRARELLGYVRAAQVAVAGRVTASAHREILHEVECRLQRLVCVHEECELLVRAHVLVYEPQGTLCDEGRMLTTVIRGCDTTAHKEAFDGILELCETEVQDLCDKSEVLNSDL